VRKAAPVLLVMKVHEEKKALKERQETMVIKDNKVQRETKEKLGRRELMDHQGLLDLKEIREM
jgi:hypothetical protein